MERNTVVRTIRRAVIVLLAYVITSVAAGVLLASLQVEGAFALAFASSPVWFASAEWCWQWVRRGDAQTG